MGKLGRRAVVIGASIAGLAAARALADYFEEVVLLERDALDDGDGPRKGAPQGRHPHVLLARGRAALEAFFPGLGDELAAAGALRADLMEDSVWFSHGVYMTQARCGLEGVLLSRPLLEGRVRRRLLERPGVRACGRREAAGLVFDPVRDRVVGVEHRAVGAPEAPVETLLADLVVDASGRGARSPAWLAAAGYPAPEVERVEVGVSYATRLYRRRPEHVGGRRIVVARGQAPDLRFGVCLAQEQDRWIVTLGGYLGDGAPAEEEGFRVFARALPSPEISAIIDAAEPLSAIERYRFPASQRPRYERLARFPAGLLVLGDALCSFNPAYGQGMTSAALQAETLADCLDAGTERLAPRFFARAAEIVETPWRIAVSADLDHPGVVAPRPPMVRLFNRYMARLQRSAARDVVLAKRFVEVANLMAPPTALLRPEIAFRVLVGGLGAAATTASAGARQ